MTPKDAETSALFWKQVQGLIEIVHTRGAEGLIDVLLEDFAHLPELEQKLLKSHLEAFVGGLPLIKQALASRTPAMPTNWKIPYRD